MTCRFPACTDPAPTSTTLCVRHAHTPLLCRCLACLIRKSKGETA